MVFGRLTRMQSCCGCISLNIGCLMIGYIEIIGNLLGIYKTLSGEDDWEDKVLYFLAALSLLTINVLLVWGVHTKKKTTFLPWLIIKFAGYVGFTIYYGIKLYDGVSLIADVSNTQFHSIIIMFCCTFASILLLAWYTFFCVYSLYKTGSKEEIKQKKEEKQEVNKENTKIKKIQ